MHRILSLIFCLSLVFTISCGEKENLEPSKISGRCNPDLEEFMIGKWRVTYGVLDSAMVFVPEQLSDTFHISSDGRGLEIGSTCNAPPESIAEVSVTGLIVSYKYRRVLQGGSVIEGRTVGYTVVPYCNPDSMFWSTTTPLERCYYERNGIEFVRLE